MYIRDYTLNRSGGVHPRLQLAMTDERHAIIQLSGGIVEMLDIRKEYIVTGDNKKRAVLIDIETFERIEEILESYGLGKYMEEVENEKALPISEAKIYYQVLEKS